MSVSTAPALPVTPATAEFGVLLEAVRSVVGGAPAGTGSGPAGEDLNWDYIRVIAGYHGVQPLLFAWLKQHATGVDSDVADTIRQRVNARTANSLFLFQQLGHVCSRLEAAGVRSLTLKGPTLAQQVYGSLALRPFVDIDLLIHPEDFGRVDALLSDDGYYSKPLTPYQKRVYVGIHRQYSYVKPSQAGPMRTLLPIDLHTAIMPPGYSCAISFDDLWTRARPMEVLGAQVMTPGTEDLLLILCYHGFKNRWDRLKYACDVSMTIREEDELDWDAFLRNASRSGGRRMALLGILLADELLQAPLPPEIRRLSRAEPHLERLAREAISRLPDQAHMRVEPYMDRLRLNLLAQDGLAGQLRYVLYSVARRASEVVLPEADEARPA